MSYTLLVKLKKTEGSVLRLLGQIGRRGYDILGVTAKLTADGRTFDVTVDFEPIMPAPPAPQQPRPADVLPALVAKLVDVQHVELRAPGALPEAAGKPVEPKAKAGKPGEMAWEE
jgi:acetolactate synthase regulatory subunit